MHSDLEIQKSRSRGNGMVNTIFVTGATGNIGGKIVTRILREDSSTRLVLLVRGNSSVEAQQRVGSVLKTLSPEINLPQVRSRLTVICGDITLNGLGLAESIFHGLASKVTHIIHAAATTQFQLTLECAHLVNCIGTKNVMAFARKAHEAGNLQRVAHISTAYVCGKKEGIIYEDEIDRRPQFSNTYQETKWEAEQLVRNLMPDLPLTIFRPSIVVGDSQTGRTIAFNVLYTPLKWIYRGLLGALPCSPDIPLDVVPVDFVSDAIYHIFLETEECIGKTYHITAGSDKSTTVGEIVDRALEYFKRIAVEERPPQIEFLSPTSYDAVFPLLPSKVRKGLQLLRVYEPYICTTRLFDNAHAIKALQDTNISVPMLSTYFDNILAYSFLTDWGRQMEEAA